MSNIDENNVVKDENNRETAEKESPAKKEVHAMASSFFINGTRLTTNSLYRSLNELKDEATNQYKYDYIIGIDFGHGETVAYILKIERDEKGDLKFEVSPLRLEEKFSVIPTMITFDEKGNPYIGNDAKDTRYFEQWFKSSPSDWTQGGKGELTNEALMKKFYEKLFEQILKHNKDVKINKAIDSSRLLICVGCPASEKWTKAQSVMAYTELVKEATGVSDVCVVPESTAALMSLMLKSGNISEESQGKIELDKGVAVFDFGSLSVDFTYILPGGKIVTRSITEVGGSDFDKVLRDVLFEKMGFKKEDFPPEEMKEILVEIREAKESFYRKNGKFEIKFKLGNKEQVINEAIMEEVMTRKDENGQSLKERIGTFIKLCKNAIGKAPISCAIVVGGGSNIIPLRKLVEDSFGKEKVTKYDNPSLCVAEGLCLIKQIEISGMKRLNEYQYYSKTYAEATYKEILNKITKETIPPFIEEIKLVLKEFINEEREAGIQDIFDRYEQRKKQQSASKNEDEKTTISELYFECNKNFQEKMTKKANEIAKNIYPENFISTPQLEVRDSEKFAKDDDVVENVIDRISSKIEKKAFKVSLYHRITYYLDKRGKLAVWVVNTFSPKWLKKLLKKLDGSWLSVEAMRRGVMNEMKKEEEYKDIIISRLLVDAEAILGKIMLQVFDEKPN